MGFLFRDVRHAVRSLRRRPLLTAAAVISLALGIGVNSAIFSAFDHLVLRKLPVPSPEQIVILRSPGRKPGSTTAGDSGGNDQVFSYPLFRDLQQVKTSRLSPIAAHRDFAANISHDGQTSRREGLLVSGSYFPVLRITPALGRLLAETDDRAPGAHPVAVLTHRYWSTEFGSDPRVIGRPLTVNGEPLTIVGVANDGFTGTTTMDVPDIFVPIAMAERLRARGVTRRDHWLYLFARLAPGATPAQAEAELRVPFTTLIRGPEFSEMRRSLRDDEREPFLARQLLLESGAHGRQQSPEQVRLMMAMLFSVTGLVLLIACANVANLLMARVTDRAGELSIRLSLGASASGLIRLLVIESLVLGLSGAIGGLAVGRVTAGLLLGMLPADDITALQFQMNSRMLLFTGLLGAATGLLFGVAPAIHGLRSRALKQGTQASASRGTTRFRTGLATAQIALATALLATAALFATSLANITRVELGLQREGVITFRLSPQLAGYTADRARALFEATADRLRNTPGVTAVTAATIPVLAGEGWRQRVSLVGADGSEIAAGDVSTSRTDADYLHTLGIPLLAGREFTRRDDATAPLVAIVNRAFAKRFGLGDQAVGRRIRFGSGDRATDIGIVGIAGDAKYSNVRDDAPPQLLLPYRQAPIGPLTFYVRAIGDLRPVIAAIPETVARLDRTIPVEQLRTLDAQVWENVTRDRLLATLSSSVAALASLLAGVGLYAVLAYMVGQRLREFGIRMAVGAGPRDVARLVATQVVAMAATGSVIGVVAALGLARLGRSMLYGLDPTAVAPLGAAAAAMVVVAIAAAAVPARRAMRVEPTTALRVD
jgi:predicted permease